MKPTKLFLLITILRTISPPFPEAIQDTLTKRARELLRVLRVRLFIHDRFKSKTLLLALEPIARNVAVGRRASLSAKLVDWPRTT
jgi:hypothetical protein